MLGDELGLDWLAGTLHGVFPEVSNELYGLGRDSGVMPCGARGYAATGSASTCYVGPQHKENKNDPVLTFGTRFFQGVQITHNAFAFGLPALGGGRGLIVKNPPGTTIGWHGRATLHGTVVGPVTVTAIENPADENYATLGISLFQKPRTLAYGRKHLTGWPKTFQMATKDIWREHLPDSLNWLGPPEQVPRFPNGKGKTRMTGKII